MIDREKEARERIAQLIMLAGGLGECAEQLAAVIEEIANNPRTDPAARTQALQAIERFKRSPAMRRYEIFKAWLTKFRAASEQNARPSA